MKARADSWYAIFTEEELWQLFTMSRRAQWYEVTKFASELLAKNHNGATLPSVSRSAYYRWLDFMREQESERRLAQARIAALEVDNLAKTVGLKDEKAIAAYKSLAAEVALKGDAKTASSFLRMAMDLRDRQLHSAEVDLKSKDLATKEKNFELAKAKFEFYAAKKAMELAAEIKTVAADDSLDEDEKIQKVREALFG